MKSERGGMERRSIETIIQALTAARVRHLIAGLEALAGGDDVR